MKKMILILIGLFILVGCDVMESTHLDSFYSDYNFKISDSIIQKYNLTINNYEVKCSDDKYRGIIWTSDMENHNTENYYQTPEETLASRKGDCEDIATLEMALHYYFTGEQGELIMLIKDNKTHMIFTINREGKRKVALGLDFYGTRVWTDLETHMKNHNWSIAGIFNYSQAMYLAYVVKTPRFSR